MLKGNSMQLRTDIEKEIRSFKTKHSIDLQDEHVIATMHLVNEHLVDIPVAQDRTSPGSSDYGIDAWHFDSPSKTLYLYQSKLTNSRTLAVGGFQNLTSAAEWLGGVLTSGELGELPKNPCIHNLAQMLSHDKDQVRTVCLRLISPFDHNEVDDCREFDEARRCLSASSLNRYAANHEMKLRLEAREYCIKGGFIPMPEYYSLPCSESKSFALASGALLDVVATTLHGLVELYRKRGDNLFEKNLRLYLGTKESRQRVEHPMMETLDQICSGKLEPVVFPFYHVGVTLAASMRELGANGVLSLHCPYVINGCQTVSIADRYLRGIEKTKSDDKVRRFREIPVVAKVVTRASDEQLREIAICNNRQNPIAPWQLFSNDPIHNEIEAALRDLGIFYERQSGKFNAMMRNLQTMGDYPHTNNTFITVEGLGQVICLCRGQLALAAKRSDIFAKKEAHDQVFDRSIPQQARNIVWAWNAHKAVVRALSNYLLLPAHDNEQSHRIFVKPIVKQAMYYMAMRHLYQRCRDLSNYYAWYLNKIAPPGLAKEAVSFYRQVILKTKAWYLRESKDLEVEVSLRSIESFLSVLGTEVGLGSDGPMPFTKNSLDWSDLAPTQEDEVGN